MAFAGNADDAIGRTSGIEDLVEMRGLTPKRRSFALGIKDEEWRRSVARVCGWRRFALPVGIRVRFGKQFRVIGNTIAGPVRLHVGHIEPRTAHADHSREARNAIVWRTRYVSLGSVVGAALAPVAVWMVDHPSNWITGAALLGGIFIIWRHRGNLARLRAGTENKL